MVHKHSYITCKNVYVLFFQQKDLASAYTLLYYLATKKGVEGKPIRIKAPLLHMTKADIIKKGLILGAPFEKTWSCYMGGRKACGRCDSCLLRLKGFKEAGSRDPIEYEHLLDWYI